MRAAEQGGEHVDFRGPLDQLAGGQRRTGVLPQAHDTVVGDEDGVALGNARGYPLRELLGAGGKRTR